MIFKFNTKVLYLFDIDQFLKRNTPEEKEFLTNCADFASDLVKAIEYGFDQMHLLKAQLPPNARTKRFEANMVNGFIQKYLIESRNTGKYLVQRNNTFYLSTDDYLISFKKMDKSYRPHYAKSKNSDLMKANYSRGKDKRPVIFMGYQVDPAWEELLGIYAVSHTIEGVNWVLSYDDLMNTSSSAVSETAEQAKKPLIIKSKVSKKMAK